MCSCFSWSLTWFVCPWFLLTFFFVLRENRDLICLLLSPNEVLQRHLLEDWQVFWGQTGDMREESDSSATLKPEPCTGLGWVKICAGSSQPWDRNLGSSDEWRQRPLSTVWKGPVPGLFVQMFLGVSHCHLWVYDPGLWQGSLTRTLKISDECCGVCLEVACVHCWIWLPTASFFKGLSEAWFCCLFCFPFLTLAHWIAWFRGHVDTRLTHCPALTLSNFSHSEKSAGRWAAGGWGSVERSSLFCYSFLNFLWVIVAGEVLQRWFGCEYWSV